MPSEVQTFQSDLLESVKQMRRGQAAKVTKVKLPEAAGRDERVFGQLREAAEIPRSVEQPTQGFPLVNYAKRKP